jgi:hypothetical protein
LLRGAAALQHFLPLRRREQDSVARGLIEFQQSSGVRTPGRPKRRFFGIAAILDGLPIPLFPKML